MDLASDFEQKKGCCRSAVDRGVLRPAAQIRGFAFAPPTVLEGRAQTSRCASGEGLSLKPPRFIDEMYNSRILLSALRGAV
jgi:hypothetical protein